MKKVLLIVAVVIAVVLAMPLAIAVGVVGILVIAAIGGLGIGVSESMVPDGIPHFHTVATGPHWSSDGRRIVFESHKRVYGIDAYGTHLEPISEDFGEFDYDAAPSLSPDGTEVIYTAVRHDKKPFRSWDSEAALVRFDLDGSRRSRIAKRSPWEIVAVWSPQAYRIAYASSGSIDTMAVDGSGVHQIVDPPPGKKLSLLPPVWSPDGEAMAFVVRDYGSYSKYWIYVVGGDGSDLTELKATISGPRGGPYADDGRSVKVPVNQPAWSPDGQRLAFARLEQSGEVKVYTIDSDGSNPREVLDLSAELGYEYPVGYAGSWHCNLTWSPDGTEILVGNLGVVKSAASGNLVTNRNLVVRSDGSGVRELSGPGGYASWSPDGSRIAVRLLTSDDPESDHGIELYTVHRDGSDARVLVKRRHEKGPPRGKHGLQDTIWILEAAGAEPLTNFPEVR